MRRRTVLGSLGLVLGLSSTPNVLAQTIGAVPDEPPLRLDVRGAGLRPTRHGAIANWGASGPGGALTANTCYLEKDGKPLAIVAGELHIQRVPPEEWEAAIIQMKAAGLNTVSSYVFWNQIERERGTFDFTGRNDLRTFFELCQRQGMMAVLRPGPFCNAEFLLGGLPVWLFGLPTTERSNDALYLDLVRRYFAALAHQLDGLFWRQGGPIAIVQLENELSVAPIGWARPFLYGAPVVGHTGPTGPAFTEHYRHLHAIAQDVGLTAPFYSATSWGTDESLPIDLLMPTYGGYMDLVPSGPKNSPLTTFTREGAQFDDKVPIGFIEIGYGTPMRDAFRPRPSPDHGYCSTMTLFGASRSLMVGYYMFRGGSNPVNGVDGWTTKDAVFPLVSYDFWAPIGEFGEWRESLFRARPFNHFVREFAPELALADPRAPDQPVADAEVDRVRMMGRFASGRGFVFISNFANVHSLSRRRGFAAEVQTERGLVRLPAAGNVDLPSDFMGVWPVNLDLGRGVMLRSATAQPVCRLDADGAQWTVFSQTGSVPVVFGIEASGVRNVRMRGSRTSVQQIGDLHVLYANPNRGAVVEITALDGHEIRLLVLAEHDAQRMALIGEGKTRRLAISEAMVTQATDGLWVTSRDRDELSVSLFPVAIKRRSGASLDGIFQRITVQQKLITIAATVRRLSDDKALVILPVSSFEGLDDIYMDVTYSGDLCRAFDAATGELLADNMNDGVGWSIGLGRFRATLSGAGLLLRVEPAAGHDVSMPESTAMTLKTGQRSEESGSLSSITFHPRYRQLIHLN